MEPVTFAIAVILGLLLAAVAALFVLVYRLSSDVQTLRLRVELINVKDQGYEEMSDALDDLELALRDALSRMDDIDEQRARMLTKLDELLSGLRTLASAKAHPPPGEGEDLAAPAPSPQPKD